MTATYDCIATTTLGSDTGTVTFSSISGTYTDLVLITSAKYTVNASHIRMRYNSDTGNNYSNTVIYGDGSSAASSRDSNVSFIAIARAGTEFATGITHIQNYSNTTTNKTSLSRGDLANSLTIAYVGLYRSTSAITTITLTADVGSFTTGSTFTLYGIKSE